MDDLTNGHPGPIRVLTPAQIHLRLLEIASISGGGEANFDRNEVTNYLWSMIMSQLQDYKRRRLIEYDVPAATLLEHGELLEIIAEFDVLRSEPDKPWSLDKLVFWIEGQVNALLEHRGISMRGLKK